MSARSKARKRALDVLYESEVRGLPLGATLEDRITRQSVEQLPALNDYTLVLVRGVAEQQARIDELISTYAEGWTLQRMPAVDRNALRLGVYEILCVDDVPDPVAISEATALVRELSTDDSPGFVNGILGTVARDKPALIV